MTAAIYQRRNRIALAAVLACLFFAFGGAGASAQSSNGNAGHANGYRGLPYAVADFDGDEMPDTATVEGGYALSTADQYSIRLRLTGRGAESIFLTAPSGGLSVEAHDVNGDHSPDLIVATKWQHRPVAVYLNDGHGSFSRVEASRYQSTFDAAELPSASALTQQTDALAGLAPESGGFCALVRATTDHVPQSRFLATRSTVVSAHEFLAANSGRAPPAVAFSL
jgi:hypothetical protein